MTIGFIALLMCTAFFALLDWFGLIYKCPDNSMNINAIGLWSLRIVLAIGMIVGGCLHNEDVSSVCAVAFILSFILLSANGQSKP